MVYQRVLLKLGQGTLAVGLAHIDAQLWGRDRSLLWQGTGSLPPAEDLLALCRHWQKYYDGLCQSLNTRVLEINSDVITNLSWPEFEALSQKLVQRFQAWLGSESFDLIYESLLSFCSRDEETQVLITTDDQFIRLLPWHRWKLFSHFPKSEFAFSLPRSHRVESHRTSEVVQILAILGVNEQIVRRENRQEINVRKDLRLFNNLPKAQSIRELILPDRFEISDTLWEETIDILFFAGHSNSNTNGEIGSFQINEHERIEIDQIKHGIGRAIEHGLKLAIFNSCNGLGLAHQLSQLNVPYLIVMRQLIPDQVAIKFLEYFLKAFAGSNSAKPGKSLYLAMREARTRLEESWDDRFPYASWLPVLFQNPTEEYLTWESLQGQAVTPSREPYQQPNTVVQEPAADLAEVEATSAVPTGRPDARAFFDVKRLRQNLKKVGLVSTIVAIAVIGLRLTTILESLELYFYDQMMRQLPDLGPDPRLVIVEITEEDIRQFGQPMSDETLTRLFKAIKKQNPLLIGFDIIRDRPEPPTPPELAELWQDPSIIPVCYTGDDEKVEETSTGFPPGMSQEIAYDRASFNDLVMDSGGIIRRQLLARRPKSKSLCQVEISFSNRLALQYFHIKKIPFQSPQLQPLYVFAGGYQWLENIHEEQILIRYRSRSRIAEKISMTALFNQVDSGEINNWGNKIVLIGTTAPSAQDISPTPYGISMEGVVIHAHMLSQLISAAEEGKPLLTTLPVWQDWFWIWGWTFLAGLLVSLLRSDRLTLVINGTIIIVSYGICFILFLKGFWVPLVPTIIALVISNHIILRLSRKSNV